MKVATRGKHDIKNVIVERIEHSLDQHSVGRHGYGLLNFNEKLDQLIFKLTSESGIFLSTHKEDGSKEKVVLGL